MKRIKHMVVWVALIMAVLPAKAQNIKDILNNKDQPITYYGIDFTRAVLIGDANANVDDIVARQFSGINDLMIKEADKYDISGALRRNEVPSNLDLVAKRNEKVNPDKLLSSNTEDFNHLVEADIKTVIKNFNISGKKGTGLLFIVDALNKPGKKMSAWVTFFDIATRRVLLTERLEGEVGMAFNFRNYWAAGFKNIIKKIDDRKFKQWASE